MAGVANVGPILGAMKNVERATGLEPALRDGLPTGFENQRATLTPRPLDGRNFVTRGRVSGYAMSKGISSRNSLKALAYPVQQFLTAWGQSQRMAAAQAGSSGALPAPYAVAALRGEGVLRLRFFGPLMDKLPVALDAAQQLALWQSLVEEGGHITDWVQRLGVARAMRREALVPLQAQQDARMLYAVLLDALERQAPALLPWAVEGFFFHVWKQQFPASAAAQGQSDDPVVLRQRLERGLRKHHAQGVLVRESFKVVDGQVDFALQIKLASQGHWQEWLRVQRPRLKTARLAAWQQGLEMLVVQE